MHELGIAMEIAEIATARAGDAVPRRIVVEVGALAAVLPDALAFAWDAATGDPDLGLAGCALEIVVIAGRGRCRACAGDVAMPRVFARCACGATDVEIVAGEELKIREMEVTHAR